MYCRGCGREINENASICMNCGVPKGKGKDFCPNCGEATGKEAIFCVKCGADLSNKDVNEGKKGKSKLMAGLLGLFLGGLGIHDFYLKRTSRGISHVALWASAFILNIISEILLSVFAREIIVTLTLLNVAAFICRATTGLWGLIEGILILCGKVRTDGDGNPLID